jgi:hypothetical protein
VEELRSHLPGLLPIRHERIGGENVPVASSRELERQSLPQTADLVERIVDCY